MLRNVVAGTLEFIDDSLVSATDSYSSVTSTLDRCGALVLVIDNRQSGSRAGARNSVPALAFDCAFLQGLPVHLLHPHSARTRYVKHWINKLNELTKLGRANLTLRPYKNDDRVYMAVSDLFAPMREPTDLAPVSGWTSWMARQNARRFTTDPPERLQRNASDRTAATLFISYAHKNSKECKALIRQLKPLIPEMIEQIWSDDHLIAGDEYRATIAKHIRDADIIIFLQSSWLLESTFIQQSEVPWALEQEEGGRAEIVSVILERCGWKEGPLERFQVLPARGKPITSWTPRSDGPRCLD